MKDKQAAQTSSIVYAHLGYARILMQQNKQPEAILLLKQGISYFLCTRQRHPSQ